MMSAKEMREKANEVNRNKRGVLYGKIYASIEDTASTGKFELNYFTGGEHLAKQELQSLRDLGYKIKWNSPCLWYEISW